MKSAKIFLAGMYIHLLLSILIPGLDCFKNMVRSLLYIESLPSVDKGTHGRRRTNFCPCFVTFLPRTSSTRQSSASQGQKLTSFRLSDPDHRYFGNLQGGRLRRTGRTLIEDNAENYRNIMVQGVCALVY